MEEVCLLQCLGTKRASLLATARGSHVPFLIPHGIRRYYAQVKLLARDLAKAVRHPVVEERLVGRHRERLDLRALGRSGGTEFFDVPIGHPLRQARIGDVSENPLNLLKATWTAKVFRYSGMLQAAGTRFNLLPVPLPTLGGWHPDAHKALCSVASTIAARQSSKFYGYLGGYKET